MTPDSLAEKGKSQKEALIDSINNSESSNFKQTVKEKSPITSDLKSINNSILTVSEEELSLLYIIPSQTMDFSILGQQLRLYKSKNDVLWNGFQETLPSNNTDEYSKVSSLLDKKLVPWLPNIESTLALRDSYNGTGIVICVGDHFVHLAIATMRMIREIHGCQLPFEIFYNGIHDLSKSNQGLIQVISNTKLVDISELLDQKIVQINGWSIKPFAVLLSTFQNAILIDADIVFLQSPELLVDSIGFRTHGALFFKDRTLGEIVPKSLEWLKSLMATPPSDKSKNLRIFKGISEHEQDSGVLLINKKERFSGLLATCILNVGGVRKIVYDRDKETFWLGFETTQDDYTFNKNLPGVIGISTIENNLYRICGRQTIYFDDDKVPLWINGGIVESKFQFESPVIHVKEYVSEPGVWKIEKGNIACLSTESSSTLISIEMLDIIKRSGMIFLEARKA
ncbi:mannosyltransferase putative-domain-containing protein [Globomyces pollinis-pini]|nr:mannosyltransferase putative-domain-containing protein [Globomyces pollinis-pini]